MLIARDLDHTINGHPVLKKLSFDLPSGLSVVIGDEGTGKTTLARLMAGQMLHEAGSIQLDDLSLSTASQSAWQRLTCLSDVMDERHDQLTGHAYLAAKAQAAAQFDAEAQADFIEGLSLQEHLHKGLYMLSAGSRRKLGLCASLASGAQLTLLDQPFAALDGRSIAFLKEVLEDLTDHAERTWVLFDYGVPPGLTPRSLFDLPPA